ncbi:MAG TPA: serine/threonine-protein kinase [Gemmatales bacterium]|nr:serine/threonine-protein kinase [Gemmatales bacterium]
MPQTTLSRHDLLQLIRESGLVTLRQLDQALRDCTSDNPNTILSHLMLAGLITEYQGRELYAGRNNGFFIGKYKVLRPLATGGMGVILHCEHIHMHHQVAVKLLPKELNEEHASVTRFYREARAVAAVKHPNIVQAFDVGQEGPWHCIVMEYVDGINLHKLVTRFGVLSEVRAAHYISQAALGLQCIMTSGLVHRDLKPGNLLLDRENNIKVLDLGLARFMDQRADDLTRNMDDEQVLGTADFISPEQALHSHDVDIRADIYSLGMTFYFLLTGHLPFKATTVAGKLMSHQNKMPKALLSRRPDVSPVLDAIITKMIQKRPSARFATPQEVVEALKPWTDVPLPMPDLEWFASHSSLFTALPATPTQSTQESPALKTAQAMPVLEPPTFVPVPPPTEPADALAGLEEQVSMYSLDRSGKSPGSRTIVLPQTMRQIFLAVAVAVPILACLILALWFLMKHL